MENETLYALIGKTLSFRGHNCRVIEILDDGNSLVLEAIDTRMIQGDRHGEAHRRVPQTFTVPLTVHGQPNPELAQLL